MSPWGEGVGWREGFREQPRHDRLSTHAGGFTVAVTLEQFGLDQLPPEQRLELLELLWDSLGKGTFTPPEWHLRTLEQRRQAAEANPSAGVPWDEFKARWLGGS